MPNTYVDYTATAAQTDFNFSFDYLDSNHVEVFIDGVETSAFTIELSPKRVVLTTPATGGETIRIRRSSDPTANLVNFVDGSVLTEADLDLAYLHNRYLNEEAFEGNTSSLQTAAGSTNFDANFNKIINLSPPTNSLDAANKNYVDDKLALSGTSLSGFNKSTHTGDNATTTFTLSFTPQTGTASAFRVAIDGVLQTPDDAYTVDSGASTITFTSAPPTNAEIVVIATGTAQDVNSIGVTATGSTQARSLADRFADVVNVLDYGASPSETAANNTTYIQNAVNAANTAGGGTVYFPAGDYAIDGQITLYSNIELKGSVDTKLMPNDSVPLEAFKATSQSNIRIVDLIFEGTGTARTANQHLLKFDTCSEVQIHNCTFRKARESAVIIYNCDQGRMSECLFENNYYYGCEVRNGSVSWVISDCIFYENGSTDTATSTFGRGIVIWESFRINVTNCTFKNNTEYGLRFYSDGDDTYVDQQIAVSNCTFENNGTTAAGKIDLYVWNNSGGIKNFAISNCTFRTRDGNTALALQGTNSVVSNCSFEAVVQDSGTAVNIFKATTASISNCVMQGFANAFSMSSTEVPDNIRISNCQCIDCYRITAGVYGDQVVFDGNYFKQSSGGQTASQTLITLPSGTTVVGARIINNTFDNAYRGIQFNIDDHTVDVSNNLFQNTSNLTIRAYGTDLSNLVFHGNTLDVATNPTELGRLELKGGQVARVVGQNNNDPVTAGYGFSYRVGDRFYNINPTAGTATDMGWVCTVAGVPGSPGAWKGFGDIAS